MSAAATGTDATDALEDQFEDAMLADDALDNLVDLLISKRTEPEDLLSLARTFEKAEDFDAMRKAMKKSLENIKDKWEISGKDSNYESCLSIAYKNLTGQFRKARRNFQEHLQEEEAARENLRKAGKEAEVEELSENVKRGYDLYKKHLEKQLEDKCKEVIDLLNSHLLDAPWISKNKVIDNAEKIENTKTDLERVKFQVFVQKMIGDYYRYLAELKLQETIQTDDGEEMKKVDYHKQQCESNYKTASELARNLPATEPTRLGLALNYSVAKYEIMEKKQDACTLAKAAFDQAIQSIQGLSNSTYKDSTLIMQLLRDNLTLWDDNEKGSGTSKD